MSQGKSSVSKLMAVLTVCASAIAALCFLLPLVTLGRWNYNVIDFMDELRDEAYVMIVAMAATGLGLLFGLIALANRKLLIVSAMSSFIALVGMFMAYSIEDVYGYAGIGFYIFVAMHLAAFVLSIVGLCKSDAT